jgi:uncharacterized protein involved in exopolysaccharide biosynthesis
MSQVGATSGTSQIRDYLGVLWRRKWWVIVVTAIAAGAAIGYVRQQTPLYSSQAQVLVPAESPATGSDSGLAAALSRETEAARAAR